MKMFGGKEQYFLRGLELSGLACRSPTPPIYNSIEAYVNWILYNMRYNALEEVDDTDTEVTQQTLESEWSKLQQQPGNEKLCLFNMDQCGLIRPDSNSTTEDIFKPWNGDLVSTAYTEHAVLKADLFALHGRAAS